MTVLYLLLLIAAVVGGRGPGGRGRRIPVATATAFGLVAVVSLLQLTVAPGLFDALRRDRAAIGDGQVWRLVTSFFVQDSGWPGTVFNLCALAVVGTLAERRWGAARWVVVALTVQILGNFWGLVVQPTGAGSSLVIFGLAAALATAAVRCGGPRGARVAGAVSLAAAVALFALRDIHGGAADIGAGLALLLA